MAMARSVLRSQPRSVTRLALGLIQMGGAVVSGVLLMATGLTTVSLLAATATTAVTFVSLSVFTQHPRRRG